MAANYEDALAQLRACGLAVESLQLGRLVRVRVEGDREKRGWYALHEIRTERGDDLIVGTFGVWQGASNNAQKLAIRKDLDVLTREQRESLRRRMAEDRRRVDIERKAAANRAATRAAETWRKCSETGQSDYLDRKGVNAYGVRFAPSGALAVPMLDTSGLVHGLQIIRTRAGAEKSGKPEKEFWPAGLAKKGHFHLIGMPTTMVLVAEGYATGASLHQATGMPVAIAFDAGNLAPVCAALRARYKGTRILVCADDDILAKCDACRERIILADNPQICPACGKDHKRINAGVTCASTAAVEVGGAFVVPVFADEDKRRREFLERGVKRNDFNDLQLAEGLHVVRAQVEARITELGWRRATESPARNNHNGDKGAAALSSINSIDELLERFALVYALAGSVFDHQEHAVMSLSDMRDACQHRELHRAWMQHPERKIVRATEVDFDPACADPKITCNLWSGWPTSPAQGRCDKLLELLRYMCSGDDKAGKLFEWVIRWLALPIQKPGAKMKTTLVVHGPQGTGKNMFFEAIMSIYGQYGRVIDQSAIEDKFNDWASRRLFLIADEVVARSDLFHIKNKLKAFITGEWIRINPKNLAARDERNHVNVVFLSNEAIPVALDEDDRRHAVIWTPEKLDAAFYTEVKAELDAGGAAALHHHLLNLDLGDFTESTSPPQTGAKDELIGLGRDSTVRFHNDLIAGEIGEIPAIPGLTKDAYAAYKAYCSETGQRAAPLAKFVNAMQRRCRVPLGRKRYLVDAMHHGPHGVLFFGRDDDAPPDGMPVDRFVGECVVAFRNAVNDYRGQRSP
jgi:putative DNA primase/helicase